MESNLKSETKKSLYLSIEKGWFLTKNKPFLYIL